jgi:tetratricopeptide (TPR) repeat protein
MLGDYSEATVWYRQALQHFQQAGDLTGQSLAHTGIAGTLLDPVWYELQLHGHQRGIPAPGAEQRRHARDGLGHAQQALVLHRELDRRKREAITLAIASSHHAILSDFGLALNTCQQALELSREISYSEGQAFAWHSLSFVHRLRGEIQAAIDCCERSLSALSDVGSQTVVQRAETLRELGDAYEAAGDQQAARRAWQDALRIFEDLHLPAYAQELRARLNPGSGGQPH